MEIQEVARTLEGHLRAQLTLLEACRDRALKALGAGHPELCSAWLDHLIRISNAMAATGSAIARLRDPATGTAIPFLACLRLPHLPVLPGEGPHPPHKSTKQLDAGFSI